MARGGPGAKSADEQPIAKLMKKAGYATGQAGKWRQVGELPGDWGFDEFLTDNTASGWYWETRLQQKRQGTGPPARNLRSRRDSGLHLRFHSPA